MTPAPSKPAAAAPAVEPYFDCRLTLPEMTLLGLGIVLAMAMQCAPVLHSPLAVPLVFLLSVLSWTSPVSGFFFIACAQSLPYPEGAPFNPAQIGALTWLPVVFARYRGIRLRGLNQLWAFAPFLLWIWLLKWENLLSPREEYIKALIYSVIACQLFNEARGRALKCLLGLCLGGLMVTNAYWGAILGLPIELSDWGGSRGDFTRLGGARADSIMVWPPTFMGAYGIIGIAFAAVVHRTGRQAVVLKNLALVVFFLSIPPLVATMSNAAYLGWVLMILWLIGLVQYLRQRNLLPLAVRRGILGLVLALVIGGLLVYRADVWQVRSRMDALKQNYERQQREEGVLASRTDVWTYSLRSIRTNPLTGRAFALEPEPNPPGYPRGYFSHNVFLDYGRSSGIPAMLLLGWFFFYPFARLWRQRRFARYMPFFLAYFAMFLFWMVLSFQFYKTFWALWMLMAMTAAYDRRTPAVARARTAAPAAPATAPTTKAPPP